MLFILIAVVCVILLLFFGTGSAFLTVCGMYEILISFPIGLFVWNTVLGEPYVSTLMFLGPFVSRRDLNFDSRPCGSSLDPVTAVSSRS